MVEATKNIDGYWHSQFFYKDRGGKLFKGPIWDWDLSFGNVFYHDGFRTNGWRWSWIKGSDYAWYRRLFEDPDSLQRCIDRWSELRTNVLATSNVLARVDARASQVKDAQARNYQRWPTLGKFVHPSRYAFRTHEEEVGWLKKWIRDRLDWIDTQDFLKPLAGERPPEGAPGKTGPKELFFCRIVGIIYTLDGSDPPLPGGAVSPKAIEYQAPIPLTNTLHVTARIRSSRFPIHLLDRGCDLFTAAQSSWSWSGLDGAAASGLHPGRRFT